MQRSKKNILVTEWDWNDRGITIIYFDVYKKSLFGGMRKSLRYDGYSLGLSHLEDGSIDLETMRITNGKFKEIPFNPDLAIGVLRALEMKFAEKGDAEEAMIVKTAYMKAIQAVVKL